MRKFHLLFLTFFMTAAAFAARVEFSDVNRSGQITIKGEGFRYGQRNDDRYDVNFYVNDDFIKQIKSNSNGSFSYTTPTRQIKNRDKITVKVLQYYSNSRHWEKSQRVYAHHDDDGDDDYYDGPRLSLTDVNLRTGQATIAGHRLKRKFGGHRIEAYVNGRYIGSGRSNENGSFSYTTPQNSVENGDRLKIVIDGYYDFWDDLEKTFIIRGHGGDRKPRIEYGSVNILGQFEIRGSGFTSGDRYNNRYEIEVRVAGELVDTVRSDSDGDFYFISGVFSGLPYLKVSVRVRDYYGKNQDWHDSAYLR